MDTKKLFKHIPWVILGIIGAFCLSVVALRRGEHVSALWIVVASVSVYLVAYRYYSLYIAQKVMKLDPTRSTPAVINNDGLNYVPTNRYVLFGHHFAAIAGAGPLVGPVLAAQMGYLPGTLWLLAGVVLAGAVQDFMVLFISSRRNGASLGEMIKQEMGPVPGSIALFGCFLIMIIILAVLALIVVKALAEARGACLPSARRCLSPCLWGSTCASCAQAASVKCRLSVSCCWWPLSGSAA